MHKEILRQTSKWGLLKQGFYLTFSYLGKTLGIMSGLKSIKSFMFAQTDQGDMFVKCINRDCDKRPSQKSE